MRTRQTASGAALLSASRLFCRALDFVALLIVARFLGPAEFGVIAVAMTLIVIVEAILELPVGLVLIRLPTLERADLDTAFTLAAIRALTLAVTVALCAWPFATLYGDERLFKLLCILSMAPAARGLVSPGMAAFAKQLNFRPDFTAEVCGKIVALAMTATIAASTSSYWALAVGTVTAPLTTSVLSYLLAPYQPRLSLARWREFAGFLGWGSASQAVNAVNWQCDRLVLGRLLGQSELGQFSMANDLSSVPFQMLVMPTMRAVMPGFAGLVDNPARLRAAYEKTICAVALVAMPVMIGLSLLAESGTRLALGGKWLAVVPILQWIALAALPDLLVAPLGALAMALNRTSIFLRLSVFQLIVKVPLMILGSLWFGVVGAVAVRLTVAVVMSLVSMVFARSLIGLTLQRQVFGPWRALASAGVMALVLLYMRPALSGLAALPLALGFARIVAVGAATYMGALLALWQVSGKPDGIESMVIGYLNGKRRQWKPSYH